VKTASWASGAAMMHCMSLAAAHNVCTLCHHAARGAAKGGALTLCVLAVGVWEKLKGEVGAVCGGLRHGRRYSVCSQVLQRCVLRLQEGGIVWAGVGACGHSGIGVVGIMRREETNGSALMNVCAGEALQITHTIVHLEDEARPGA
jgi:hypothetical protein